MRSSHHHVGAARAVEQGAPAAQWVSRALLEQQLMRVHGKVLDPQVGLYGPDSMMWRIGRNHLAGFLGAGRALLLQIAHPWITQGVDHHSATRHDPVGRAHRTFATVLTMIFGSLEQACAAARSLYANHARIQGVMDYPAGAFEQGSVYRANEVNALVWVQATLWDTSMRMYELVVEPVASADKARYYAETKLFAYLVGIPDSALPPDWNAFVAYNERMWESDQLAVTPAARQLTEFLLRPPNPALAPATRWMRMITAATLPPRLRRDFGLSYSEASERQFQRSMRRLRLLQRRLPDRLRFSPAWYEALARIEGRESDAITQALMRIALGRWRLFT